MNIEQREHRTRSAEGSASIFQHEKILGLPNCPRLLYENDNKYPKTIIQSLRKTILENRFFKRLIWSPLLYSIRMPISVDPPFSQKKKRLILATVISQQCKQRRIKDQLLFHKEAYICSHVLCLIGDGILGNKIRS